MAGSSMPPHQPFSPVPVCGTSCLLLRTVLRTCTRPYMRTAAIAFFALTTCRTQGGTSRTLPFEHSVLVLPWKVLDLARKYCPKPLTAEGRMTTGRICRAGQEVEPSACV